MNTDLERIGKNNGSELKSTRVTGNEKRPFLVGQEGEKGLLRYYDLAEVKMMRAMKYVVIPTIDFGKKIKSIDLLPSDYACELCEDTTESIKEVMGGVKKAAVRIGYEDGYRLVCVDHNPKNKELTKYSKWIIDN